MYEEAFSAKQIDWLCCTSPCSGMLCSSTIDPQQAILRRQGSEGGQGLAEQVWQVPSQLLIPGAVAVHGLS